jgi:hypothetical protein
MSSLNDIVLAEKSLWSGRLERQLFDFALKAVSQDTTALRTNIRNGRTNAYWTFSFVK